MGTMPMGKLIGKMSLPLMISMLIQAAYNIVDSIFVARLGIEAIAAIGIAFPTPFRVTHLFEAGQNHNKPYVFGCTEEVCVVLLQTAF